ncbi:mitochondrial inner membrane protein OXA1L isoform X2 [Anoplopoma fimbria]|uniref:mitochondrial inner membrane protein OXA1L isoform X2 n=1 Tax=Anoplopoma fimbria TaxID=229290 RepID=UPI0023ECFD99|nr:mitochondrial inner membrane protein OXA1L isoform X2 [Anoplopoma fimbria]
MDFFKDLHQMFSSPDRTFHGLRNQGATCYLNSVLQVLFMTEDFREAVKRHTNDNPGTECIDHHLNSLFDDLQKYEAFTYQITKRLCIDNVYEQRDATEYFEKILGLTSDHASQIFHGELTQKTKCSKCLTETGSDGLFWNLALPLVNSYNGDYRVVDGIAEYFRASDFSGENQMYCDVCDEKSDATIYCEVKNHPEVLMLLLKRFEFDYRYMTYVKINLTVEVPFTLHIPENQTYELYAVVDHFGDLRSGHYNATIKTQDDERWYRFDDDRVTLLNYRPLQVDNFEKSSSAYLLFYRKKKVHAADTCTQDFREMSTPEGFPPATSDIYDKQGQDDEQMAERKHVEVAAEASNEPAVTVSIDINEETAIEDKVSVDPRGEGLSPDLYRENQDNEGYSRPSNHQECKEDRNNLSYHEEKQSDKDKIMRDDEEDKRGNAQADNQTEQRESLSRETQLQESVDDQGDGRNRTGDVRQRRPQEGLEGEDMHITDMQKQEDSNMHPHEVCVDMQMDVNRDKGAERQDNEGLVNVRQNAYEYQEGTQEVGQNYLKPVGVDKQDDGERVETEDEGHKERKAGRDELWTKDNLCNDPIQGSGVGKIKQNPPKDDQRCKRKIGSRFCQSQEHLRDEEGDVMGGSHQKRGDDEHAHRRGASERQGQDQNGRSEHVTMQKDVGAAKRAKGGNEHIQRGADSSFRQAGLAGSSRVTENRGDGSVEKCEPSNARTGLNEETMEGRSSSKQSKTYTGKIIEEEIINGVQTNTLITNIRIKTVKDSPQGSIKSLVEYDEGNVEIKSDTKTDTKVTLLEGVSNLQLKDSPLPKPQKRRKEENETKSRISSNARKIKNVSEAQEQAVGIQHAKKQRGGKRIKFWHCFSPLKQKRKEKKKRNKTTGCLSVFRKSRKTGDQTSESE